MRDDLGGCLVECVWVKVDVKFEVDPRDELEAGTIDTVRYTENNSSSTVHKGQGALTSSISRAKPKDSIHRILQPPSLFNTAIER